MAATVSSVETYVDLGPDVEVPPGPLTLDEFFALPYELIELVEGQPIIMSAAAGPHQVAVTRLMVMLLRHCPSGYEVVASPIDWVLWGDPRATVRQPDLAVARLEQLRETRLTEPPLLAVEVVSNASVERDLVAKRNDYARAGCPHYWLVLPSRTEIVRLRLDGDTYVEAGRISGTKPVTVDEPYPITVDPRRLLV